MVRTLVGMQHVPLTFDPARILTMRVPFAETRYPAPDDRARFLRALLTRVTTLPGGRTVRCYLHGDATGEPT